MGNNQTYMFFHTFQLPINTVEDVTPSSHTRIGKFESRVSTCFRIPHRVFFFFFFFFFSFVFFIFFSKKNVILTKIKKKKKKKKFS